MKKISFYLVVYISFMTKLLAQEALEPFSYNEDFEDRELGAWASYPLWQDTAYDPNFRVNEIVPQDPNISIVQKVTPYTNVDNYAGAQKLLNIYLSPGAKVSLRYYLKTNQNAEYFKVRFAAGEYGKLDVTIPNPTTNKWANLTVDFDDLVRENPELKNLKTIKVYALAFLTKIPKADPDMPFYLGLDDIQVEAQKILDFQFSEPVMFKLPEFEQYIPKKHYNRDDSFSLKGRWPLDATKVSLEIVSYTDQSNSIHKAELTKNDDIWTLNPVKLSYQDGLYVGKLMAYKSSECLSKTEFTIHIAPRVSDIAGKHPRLLYDGEKKKQISERFKEDIFKPLYDSFVLNAKEQREKIPLESLVFDLDQFPDEVWLPTWSSWVSHIFSTAEALRSNAMAYTFHNDEDAGIYAKEMLLKLSEWPNWSHPWQTKRGRYSEHNTGSWSHRLAEAYDLTYDLMTPEESSKIRGALIKNIIKGGYQTYVYNDNITSKTSNWLAMITGGSLMNMAAIYADGPETENLEPYFTGTLLKYYTFLNRVTDSKDGSWGEGLGYNSYSMSNLAYSIPSLNNVFNIDVSGPLVGTYNEYIWAGLVKERKWFDFGDSTGDILPIPNWAFLLDMQKESRLGWYYNYLKQNKPPADEKDYFSFINKTNKTDETFQDVLYDTKNISEDSPFDESPIKAFHNVGTTVFKSGWEKDDFVFVMRTGPFYNHQHLDQGSFYIADHGNVFIEDRHLSTSDYYDDPLYQSWLTQPIAHSTILLDGNHQSQRVGDPLGFADGFNDYAFIAQFLDGKSAGFSSGDIGRLYWDKVKSLTRNVLYLKPRTVLMIDVAIPEKDDVDVSLLYQTMELADINVGQNISKITKNGTALNIIHLSPNSMEVEAVETPHYLKTLRNERPLKKEGMITVTSRMNNAKPLVMANILTTEEADNINSEPHEGFVSGMASGKKFAYTTDPGKIYNVEKMQTDAISMTWNDSHIFVASATSFGRHGVTILKSDIPMTFELSDEGIKYYHHQGGKIIINSSVKPNSITLNSTPLWDFEYDAQKKEVTLKVPKGEGILVLN